MPDQIIRARLIENRDFVTCFPKSESESHGGQNRKEYLVTFDAAKQIGMMCGTDKGFEIRDYFIECEKKVLAPVQALDAFRVPQTLQEAMRVAADALDGTSPAGVRRHPCVRACPIRDSVEVWR